MLFLNYDANGRAKITQDAPSGATFKNGSAYNSAGELHISTDSPASTDPRIGGLAHKPTGEVYVDTGAVGGVYHGGLRLTVNGAIYVASEGTIAYSGPGGLPLTSTDQLVTTIIV